jgi:hypothetical protein
MKFTSFICLSLLLSMTTACARISTVANNNVTTAAQNARPSLLRTATEDIQAFYGDHKISNVKLNATVLGHTYTFTAVVLGSDMMGRPVKYNVNGVYNSVTKKVVGTPIPLS